MKQCIQCRGNLADFVTDCPYCGVAQPAAAAVPQPGWNLPPTNSNKAIASLVCGVLFFFWPTAVAAVVLGHLALSEIKRSAGRLTGQGLATAGLVMGYLGIGIAGLFLVAFVVGIRSALRQDVSGNETAAIANMRKYNQAMAAYKAKCPQLGYPTTLSKLGPGKGDCARANLVEQRLAIATPASLGYQYVYTPGVHGPDQVTVFAMIARPVRPGFTGKRFFYLDEAGVIRVASSRIIGPNSPPLDDDQHMDDDDDEPKAGVPPKTNPQ